MKSLWTAVYTRVPALSAQPRPQATRANPRVRCTAPPRRPPLPRPFLRPSNRQFVRWAGGRWSSGRRLCGSPGGAGPAPNRQRRRLQRPRARPSGRRAVGERRPAEASCPAWGRRARAPRRSGAGSTWAACSSNLRPRRGLHSVVRTALHLACTSGQSPVVALLIQRKCDLDACDEDGKTALIKAVQCRKEACVTILLEHGADPDLEDDFQNTALHYAVLAGDTSIAAELLRYNANIEAINKV
nr:ankyrin repeat domain-containing protein 65-like [Camelus dromedarius]